MMNSKTIKLKSVEPIEVTPEVMRGWKKGLREAFFDWHWEQGNRDWAKTVGVTLSAVIKTYGVPSIDAEIAIKMAGLLTHEEWAEYWSLQTEGFTSWGSKNQGIKLNDFWSKVFKKLEYEKEKGVATNGDEVKGENLWDKELAISNFKSILDITNVNDFFEANRFEKNDGLWADFLRWTPQWKGEIASRIEASRWISILMKQWDQGGFKKEDSWVVDDENFERLNRQVKFNRQDLSYQKSRLERLEDYRGWIGDKVKEFKALELGFLYEYENQEVAQKIVDWIGSFDTWVDRAIKEMEEGSRGGGRYARSGRGEMDKQAWMKVLGVAYRSRNQEWIEACLRKVNLKAILTEDLDASRDSVMMEAIRMGGIEALRAWDTVRNEEMKAAKEAGRSIEPWVALMDEDLSHKKWVWRSRDGRSRKQGDILAWCCVMGALEEAEWLIKNWKCPLEHTQKIMPYLREKSDHGGKFEARFEEIFLMHAKRQMQAEKAQDESEEEVEVEVRSATSKRIRL